MQVIKDQIAYDAKQRRAMRNKARRNGDPMGLLNTDQGKKLVKGGKGLVMDNLLATYKRAQNRNELLQALGKVRDKDPQAQRLYKTLQNHWYNRTDVTEEWLCEGKPTTKGKQKRQGKSIPLV